ELAPADADRLAAAWTAAGSLGELADDPEDDRGQFILGAVESRDGMCDKTLLGGILDQRFGADGLLGYVSALLAPVAPADVDTFLAVAVGDACDFDGIDMAVVAGLADVVPAEAPAIRQRLIRAGLCSG